MFKKATIAMILLSSMVMNTFAITPSGGWKLKNDSTNVKDYFMRIDVDSGETYLDKGYAPSSVYWAEYITFNNASGGYLGLQRAGGNKKALVSIWGGLDAKPGILPVVYCYESGACSSVNGTYDWKVGHKYRFRVEQSPRTTSDDTGDWWQVTLADLTTGTLDILGEIKTPKWGGLNRLNGVFLEYFWGPYECNTLRHAKATEAQIKGDYGQDSLLESSNGNSYGNSDPCNQQYILPGMEPKDYGSSSWDTNGTLTLLGNNYRGIHKWGTYQNHANKRMMFASNPNSTEPYIYEALHDGSYGDFPPKGSDNQDWKSIGIGYPIINDLYFRNQRVYEWNERNNSYVNIGDYFIYHNTYNTDTEYFKLKKARAGYFPIDKTNNDSWEYVGRYPKKDELLSPDLPVHQWDDADRTGKKGWLYYDPSTKLYFILKSDGDYWYFPTSAEDNKWWQFAGYHT
ncbi:DUF3472 domain-containing protein [Xenorhabdus anantnagensis]|uniref:Uncharacterized protein n=1 Tax=Xenorhabdus anantnagensis TaxID=3025875 RepID=A0ABT5LPF4_9GAMM|nr:hypothetical protein [Xenorhabdus anantnagensis]MDC9596278.1 hypothetical protein [Xenorhabdus anantnagensis]